MSHLETRLRLTWILKGALLLAAIALLSTWLVGLAPAPVHAQHTPPPKGPLGEAQDLNSLDGEWECEINDGNVYKSTMEVRAAGLGKWSATVTMTYTNFPPHQQFVGKPSEIQIYAAGPRHFRNETSGTDDPNPSARGSWKQEWTGTLDEPRLHWQVVHTRADGQSQRWSQECVRVQKKELTSKWRAADFDALFGKPKPHPAKAARTP